MIQETAGKVCLAGNEWGVIGQKTTSQVIVQFYTVQQEGSGNSVLATFKVSYILRWWWWYCVLKNSFFSKTYEGKFLNSLPFTKPKTNFQSKSLDPYITLDLKQEGALPGLESRSAPHDIHVLSCQLLCKSKPNEEDRSNVKDRFVSSWSTMWYIMLLLII